MQPDDFSPLLQAGERVLWSERRRQVMDGVSPIPLVAGGVALGICGLLVLEALFCPIGTDENSGVSLIFLGLSLCCFILAGFAALNHRRQVYVLTQRRIIIATRSAHGLHSEQEFPLSPRLLKALVRHPDGTVSFIFDTVRMSHAAALPVGFIGVRHVAELEALLTRCGVTLSAAEEAGRSNRPRPRSVDILFALITAGIAAFCFIRDAQDDTELMLTLHGEHATATIVGHQQQYHRTGKRDGDWRYYPVLQFRTAEGATIRAIDRFNEQTTANNTGEQADLLYAPHKPTVVMQAAPSRFMRPFIMLLVFGAALYMGLSGLCRLHTHRL